MTYTSPGSMIVPRSNVTLSGKSHESVQPLSGSLSSGSVPQPFEQLESE